MAQQAIVEQAVAMVAKQLENQIDDEMNRLDNLGEGDLDQIRQQRMQQMKKRQEMSKEWIAKGHGEYGEVHTEKEFFAAMKGEEKMVCHFYRENWPCKVMDKHLNVLAKKHLETKFIKLNAEKAPFLVDRLKIWMLPTLALIKLEKTVDYVVGFDELGGTDEFDTEVLAQRLAKAEIIDYDWSFMYRQQQQEEKKSVRNGIYTHHKTASDEDSDFD